MLPVTAVHFDDGGLVTMRVGIRTRSTECLGPVSGETLDMLRVETVAKRMPDDFVGHHSTMPSVGKAAQAVHSTRCLEDGMHASIMTIAPCLRKTMATVERLSGCSTQSVLALKWTVTGSVYRVHHYIYLLISLLNDLPEVLVRAM